jgi:hypothetical protein
MYKNNGIDRLIDNNTVKDLEFLILADLAYERFKNDDNGYSLNEIFKDHQFKDEKTGKSIRKQTWNYFKDKMSDWKLLEGFDLDEYFKKYPKDKEEYENEGFSTKCQYDGFYAVAFIKDNDIVIAFRGTDDEVKGKGYSKNSIINSITNKINFFSEMIVTNGKIVCGIPGIQFKLATNFYKYILKKYKNNNIYLTGHSLGGGLAQYVSVIGNEHITKTVTWNGVGIKHFGKINGFEFANNSVIFDKIFPLNSNIDEKQRYILKLLDKKEIIYLNDDFFKKSKVEYNDFPKLLRIPTKEEIKEIVNEIVDNKILTTSNNYYSKELIKDNYINDYDIDTIYQTFVLKKEFQDILNSRKRINTINYSHSLDLTGTIFKHIGKRYLVNDDLIQNNKGLENITVIEANEKIKKDKLAFEKYHGLNMFYPFIKLSNENGYEKNYLRMSARENDITNRLNTEYLKAYLKGLLKYFDISNNQELAEAVFYSTYTNKYKKTFIDELIRILSVDKLNEFIQNEGFFKDIKELEKHLEHRCITTLIPYEVDANKFSLILADEEDDDNLLVFNNEFNIDNKKEKLDFSYKTPTRYKIEFNDKKTEIESLNIYSGIGYKKTKNIVEYEKVINSQSEIIVDGQNLAGTYNEVKREDSLIKDKINVIGKVRFFDNNIILLNDTTLVHYYGDNLENKLTITHWKQGDLGITLEKMQVINELIYYNDLTFYHFKINCVNYKTLTHLEITKEISNHTKVILQGAIDFDELERVRRNLLVETPLIEIYYGDNQQVIFGGIVTDYDINIVGQNCIVKLIAYSTSIELDKNLENKIYHNQGMTYEELINKFNEKYQNIFNIGFNSDLDTKEFLNIERPVEIQHNETDWEFLKRVLSKEKELLITEDTKTLENKTPTLIAIGEFSKVNDDILNKNILIKRRRKGNIQEIRYVINHKQIIGKELFTIGNWYKLKLSDKHEEEMLLVKNKIYLEKNELKSELEFVSTKEEAIGIIKRKENIKGLTLKGVVKKVSNTHRAQIEYINIENEYDEEKSYYYPISRIYDGAYFTPEEESIVEVTFVSEEGKAMITNVSSEIEDISNEPGEKIIRTNYGKEIRLNKEEIKITGKDEDSYVEISEKLVALRKGKHNINILDGKVEIINEKGKFILEEGGIKGEIGGSALNMSEKSIVLNSGGVGIEIGNGKINLG